MWPHELEHSASGIAGRSYEDYSLTTVSRKYHPDRLFNPTRRRIFRTHISVRENAVSAALIILIVTGLGTWIASQGDNYDPAERDISLDALRRGSIADLPYRAPLKRWREAGPAGADDGPNLGPFSSRLLDGGWTIDGRVESYDASNLYEKINGQAEQYLKFGFRRLDYVTQTKDGLFVTLELYDQGTFRNALGVFASQRDAAREVETEDPLYYYRTAVGAVGVVGHRFFKVAASAADESVRSKTDALLRMLRDLPRSLDPSDLPFSILSDRLGLPFRSVAFVKENALQYEFLNDTWFGTIDSPGGPRIFLHRASTDDDAQALFDRLVEEQGFEYAMAEATESRAIMRHEFLGTIFAAAHRGTWLYGVDGAADQPAAVENLSRIEKELR